MLEPEAEAATPLPLLPALMGVDPLPEGEDATALHLSALQVTLVHVSLRTH